MGRDQRLYLLGRDRVFHLELDTNDMDMGYRERKSVCRSAGRLAREQPESLPPTLIP